MWSPYPPRSSGGPTPGPRCTRTLVALRPWLGARPRLGAPKQGVAARAIAVAVAVAVADGAAGETPGGVQAISESERVR